MPVLVQGVQQKSRESRIEVSNVLDAGFHDFALQLQLVDGSPSDRVTLRIRVQPSRGPVIPDPPDLDPIIRDPLIPDPRVLDPRIRIDPRVIDVPLVEPAPAVTPRRRRVTPRNPT